MISLDSEEEYENQRHLLEYQISFVPGSGEAVQRIWDARRQKDSADNRVAVSSDDFEKTLEMFRNNTLDQVLFRPEK